ncbi:MAG: hypothetical protein KDB22_10725 [Planctomycetales bacterium]|nr:hypothetical protein [Planctomycetales bacterium]
MSNPFAVFRKNQKTWMAALVLLALLAFVVMPALQQISDSFRMGSADKTLVVSWNGGRMTVADVQNYGQKHGVLVRVLRNLAEEVIEKGGQPQVPGFYYDEQQGGILGLGVSAGATSADICRTRIMATYAKRLGINFSDDAIDEFIKSYCDRRVTRERLAEIIQESSGGQLRVFDLRELLKDELAAMVAAQIGRSGAYAQPPGKTYRDFRRITRTTKVEAFPVLVSDYLSQVQGEPTPAELESIYQSGLSQIADPYSPEPGFVQPFRTNIEYVEANLDDWTQREKEKLSDDVLRAEYDKRVELGQYRVVEAPDAGPAGSNTGAAEASSAADFDAGTEGTESSAPEETVPDQPSATENSQGSDDTTNEGQSALPSSAARFVAFNQDATNTDSSPTGSSDTPATEATDDTPPPVIQPPQLGEDSGDVTSEAEAPQMRIQSFEEVRDDIAQSLAQTNASPAMQEAMTKLMDEYMKPYYNEYRQYQVLSDPELEETQPVEPPKRPDVKAIAEELGLKYVETGMVDGYQLAQEQFGQSTITGASGQQTVAAVATSSQIALFQPMNCMFFDQAAMARGEFIFKQYIFWKVEEKEAYIPDLASIRDDVVGYWQRTQARQIAAEAAQAIAAKVGVGEDPWNAALSETDRSLLIQTDRFTWLQRFGNSVNIAPAEGLDAVGSQFMEAVFSAQPGAVITAPNQPQTVYYVTRVIDFDPPEDDLHERFKNDTQKTGPLLIAQQETNDLFFDWYQNLETSLQVEWQMPPSVLN